MTRTAGLRLRIGAIGVVCCAARLSSAAEQTFDPRVEVGGMYDSNLRLVAAPLNDRVAGGYFDGRATWNRLTPLTKFMLSPRLRAFRYSGNGERGLTSAYLSSSLTHTRERSEWRLTADVSKQDVLTADLLYANSSGNLGNPGTGGVGLAFNNRRAVFINAAPSARWDLGVRSQFWVEAQYSQVRYDLHRVQTSSAIDYRNLAATVGLSWQTTAQLRWVAKISADQFSPQALPDAHSVGANLEVWQEESRLVRAFARLGAVRSRFSAAARRPESTNIEGGLGLQRDLSSGALLWQVTRQVDASSDGQIVVRDEMNLRLDKPVSERLQGSVGGSAVWVEPVDQSPALRTRRYFVAALAGQWRLRRSVALAARYEYSSNHNQNSIATAVANAVYISAVFEPHRRS